MGPIRPLLRPLRPTGADDPALCDAPIPYGRFSLPSEHENHDFACASERWVEMSAS